MVRIEPDKHHALGSTSPTRPPRTVAPSRVGLLALDTRSPYYDEHDAADA